MTPNSPDEAIHFRGKTLTPESPRPLHFPEPSNIPVLENQMDPIFNDTSTYEKQPSSQNEEQPSQMDPGNEVLKSIEMSGTGVQDADRSEAQETGNYQFPYHSFKDP